MRKNFGIKILSFIILLFPSILLSQNKTDTSYISIAPVSIQRLLAHGKAPLVTIQVSAFYDIGLTDLAANDNTIFSKENFINGKDYGTRYGYGFGLTGKISLHKKGNARLLVTGMYNRFQSNFIISESPEGRVGYNVFSGGLGIENCFTPENKLKYLVGLEILASVINGKAVLTTDSTDFNVKIKNSFRLGFSAIFGIEYAFTNSFGMNLGLKMTYANALLKKSENPPNLSETYLNDEKTATRIPYAGWKQFFYSSFYTGFNFYIGMKNKK